jgi:hypothetical protein
MVNNSTIINKTNESLKVMVNNSTNINKTNESLNSDVLVELLTITV